MAAGILVVISQLSGPPAAASPIQGGDVFVYDLTIEQQVHEGAQPSAASPPDAGFAQSKEGAGQGTERIAIVRVDRRGFARARITLDLVRQTGAQRWRLVRDYSASIAPSGEILPDKSMGMQLDEITSFTGVAPRSFALAPMRVGLIRTTAQRLAGNPIALKLTSKITGRQLFGPWPTFAVATSANGSFKDSLRGRAAAGSISLGGTCYYDEADRLIVGGALRTLTILDVVGPLGPHVDASTSIDLMLRSLTHAPRLSVDVHSTAAAKSHRASARTWAHPPIHAPPRPGGPRISPAPLPYGTTASPSVPEPAPTASPGGK